MTVDWGSVMSAGSAGAGAGLSFFAIRWLAVFAAGRWDRREAQLDDGTQRLIKGLESQIGGLTSRIGQLTERLDYVEKELSECKRMHAESEAQRMRVEAILQGYGDVRQTAQLIVSAEKHKDKSASKGADA